MSKEALEALEILANVELPNGTNRFDVRKIKNFEYLNEQIDTIKQALTRPSETTKEQLRDEIIKSITNKYNEECFYKNGKFLWKTKNVIGFVTFERLLQLRDYENVIKLAKFFELSKGGK